MLVSENFAKAEVFPLQNSDLVIIDSRLLNGPNEDIISLTSLTKMSKQMLSLDRALGGKEEKRQRKRGCLIIIFTKCSL